MQFANIVGVAAGLLSIASFIPQILKLLRERDASGVSLRMFVMTVTGFGLWTTYGVLNQSWPVTASNAICLALALFIVALRLKFGGEAPPRRQ